MSSSGRRVMLWLSAFFMAMASVAADTNFVYDGYGYSQCGSNAYGLQLQSLMVECDKGVCSFGNEAIVNGTFSTAYEFPLNGTVEVKLCKWWGASCSQVLAVYNFTACDELEPYEKFAADGTDLSGECPGEGYYSFYDTFDLPDSDLVDNFLENTFKFTLSFRFVPWYYPYDQYNDNYNQEADQGLEVYKPVSCHVQFRKYDGDEYYPASYQVTYAAIIALLGLVGVGAYGFKNRRCCVQSDLDDLDDNDSTDFVSMARADAGSV